MYRGGYVKCALFSLFFYQTSWCFPRFSQYNRIDAFAGRKCRITDTVVQLDNVLNSFQCSVACLNEYTCLSFFYQNETKQCYGCSTGYGVNNNPKVPTEDLVGSAYYVGYRYMGCVSHLPRVFKDIVTSSHSMTTELCAQKCVAEGKRYFMTEAKNWCFCGSILKEHDHLPENRCDLACSGDAAQICGGSYKGSLYTVGP